MEKTVMQKHLEWLKSRMYITPQMETALLNEEKQQIEQAFDYGYDRDDIIGEEYYESNYKI